MQRGRSLPLLENAKKMQRKSIAAAWLSQNILNICNIRVFIANYVFPTSNFGICYGTQTDKYKQQRSYVQIYDLQPKKIQINDKFCVRMHFMFFLVLERVLEDMDGHNNRW